MTETGADGQPVKFHDLFALDMQSVLVSEISTYFANLEPVELCHDNLAVLREYEQDPDHARKGLYILHHEGGVVYVGKTDGSLHDRLTDHYVKLSARQNIAVSDVSFRCLYLDRNWSALAHETGLIEENKRSGGCSWNNAGFGLHDPGRNRDGTIIKDDHFDRRYPVNPNIPVEITGGNRAVWDVLQETKDKLPYLFRYENQNGFSPRGAHPDYMDLTVRVPRQPTARSILEVIVDSLGQEWQVSFLFGYAILYKGSWDYGPESCQCYRRGGDSWVNPS